MRRPIVLLIALAAITSFACTRPSGSETGARKKLTIAVIPKGTTHEFWKSIHAGSIKAARELSSPEAEVELIWKGPLREDDREQQIQVVEGFSSQGVNGIVLAPLDNRALVRPGGGSQARHRPDGDHRFGSGVESDHQFRRNRQSEGRKVGRGTNGSTA